MIHFDTSFLVDLLRERRRGGGGPAHDVLDAIADEDEAGVSVHAVCELHVGAALAAHPARELAGVRRLVSSLSVAVPDPATFPDTYARLLAHLQRRGTPVATTDLLIGTAAVEAAAPLVTRNEKHFDPIPDLDVRSY